MSIVLIWGGGGGGEFWNLVLNIDTLITKLSHEISPSFGEMAGQQGSVEDDSKYYPFWGPRIEEFRHT